MVSAYDGGRRRRPGPGPRRFADHLDRQLRGKTHRGRQGQLGARAHPGAAEERRIDAEGREAGVPAARRRAGGVHPAPGRRVGDLGSLHRPSCRAAPGAQHRPGRATSPTGTGSASPPIRRWPTRNATPRWPICWSGSRRPRAGPRKTPSNGRRATPRPSGLDPKVAEVSQGRSLRLPDRAGRRGGGFRAEDRRPVRRVRTDRFSCTRIRQMGGPSVQRCAASPAAVSTN